MMAFSKLTFFSTCVIVMISCKSQIVVPKNLDEAVLYFQQKWSKDELDKFKKKPEENAVTELHFGTGTWIRNNWVHGKRETALTNYFYSLGIFHPDDISSIILTSLHRTLNKKDVQLDQQVESYKEYWKPIMDCHEKQKAQAVSNYNEFKTGDSITIYMPVDTSDGSRNAVLYECPTTDWTFDAAKDLVIKGTIVNKYFINDRSNVFFTVYIMYMNRKDTPILLEQTKTGDKKDFSVKGLTIE